MWAALVGTGRKVLVPGSITSAIVELKMARVRVEECVLMNCSFPNRKQRVGVSLRHEGVGVKE